MKLSQQKQVFTYLAITLGIATIVVIAFLFSSSSTTATKTSSSVTSSAISPSSVVTVGKTGTFTSNISYRVPKGTTIAKFSLTLKDSTITSATVSYVSGDRDSREYIDQYNSGFLQAVENKNISDISEVYISGATLTTSAFDKALQDIKSQ
jgi:flagellar basal body-associated protein FliL